MTEAGLKAISALCFGERRAAVEGLDENALRFKILAARPEQILVLIDRMQRRRVDRLHLRGQRVGKDQNPRVTNGRRQEKDKEW